MTSFYQLNFFLLLCHKAAIQNVPFSYLDVLLFCKSNFFRTIFSFYKCVTLGFFLSLFVVSILSKFYIILKLMIFRQYGYNETGTKD